MDSWFDAIVIEIVADLVCAGLLLSVTETLTLKVPLAVGVPEMTPVVDPRVSPAGRLPELTTAHV